MTDQALIYLGIYFGAISFLAIGITLYDKSAARNGAWRVKEKTLLIISALDGSVAMYMVMRIIRHKTKHIKFMAGIPIIIVLQIAATLFVLWKLL